MRRQQLTEAQITALFDPPTDQRELVRHYTLSAADLATIRRCRGDHIRLGHALMLCYLRYPGRPLRVGAQRVATSSRGSGRSVRSAAPAT
jgi:TnpA family transposase